MHCSINQKYKLLKSAMVCLMMGSAFVSTDGVLSTVYGVDNHKASEEVDTSPVARVKSLREQIKAKHGDYVYERIVSNTEQSSGAVNNLGAVLHKVSAKLNGYEEMNKLLLAINDPEKTKIFAVAYELMNQYFEDAVSKLKAGEQEFLNNIARDFYALEAFFDVSLKCFSYKNLLTYMDEKYKSEFDVAKETQSKVIEGATQEKESTIQLATKIFEEAKKAAEDACKSIADAKTSAIKHLEESNAAMMKSTKFPSKLVSENEAAISQKRQEILKAELERDKKVSEAEKVRDEAIKGAEKKFSETKAKQEEELKKVSEKSQIGTKDLREHFSWMTEPLGGGLGGKTLARLYHGKPQTRDKYPYHEFNKLLAENPHVASDARLDFVEYLVANKADAMMLHIMGVGDDDMAALAKRAKEAEQKLMSRISQVSSTDGHAGKKKANK